MNVLDQIHIKSNPFSYGFTPKRITMSPQEISILPALISELVDMQIQNVYPFEYVGRVMTFDVTARDKISRIVFCKSVNLQEYYFIWKQATHHTYLLTSDISSLYAKMLRTLNISSLETDEAGFLFVELIKFKNEYVRA